MSDIAVIGAGSYGSCLAMLFGRAGHRVSLWCRNGDTAEAYQRTRANESYLPGHTLPDSVAVTSDLATAVRGKQFVVGVTPSHGIRQVFGQALAAMDPDAIVINASKGLDEGSLATIDRVYAEILPERLCARATYLSGPTFANEIAAGTPAAIVLAGRDQATLRLAQEALTSLHFRIYRTDDVIGVLVGGALKNVVAIGAGVCDGMGFGSNTRVALMTRGLAEITRINRRVGLALGRGKKMVDVLAEMTQVAEGVKTAKVAHELATKLGVEAPIMAVMHAAIHLDMPMREAVEKLLARPVGSERD